jgi:hypothetical protein
MRFIIILLLLPLAGCTMLLLSDESLEVSFDKTDKVLLIVDALLYPDITGSVNGYIGDLDAEGSTVYLATWSGGSATDLKGIIEDYYHQKKIGGAFLVGSLPVAWYEQNGFNGHEEFPCDLYLMDMDATWGDTDKDGILDYQYFGKVHTFRNGGLGIPETAYIFKDNDWAQYNKGSSFELDEMYNSVEICEDMYETDRASYITKLVTTGAEYVYQWIHAYPPLLCIEGDDSSFQYIFTSDITSDNFKGLFYNLFNCSASRFTEENIAMTSLVKTDYGIATLGSTKIGGNYYPKVFHKVLSENGSWGDAFKAWYNDYGVTDDLWFMGMVILGDPMLIVSKKVQKRLKPLSTRLVPPGAEEIEDLQTIFLDFTDHYGEGTFEEYKNQNPDFFSY